MRNNKMELRMAMADFNNTTEMEMDAFEAYALMDAESIWQNAQSIIREHAVDAFEDIVDALVADRLALYCDEEREEMGLVEYSRHLDNGDEGYSWDFYSDWFKDVFGFRPRW